MLDFSSFRRRSSYKKPSSQHNTWGTRRLLCFEPLEERRLLSVSWLGGTGSQGTYWDVASNWSNDAVPTVAETVTINSGTATTITIQSGDSESVQSLTLAAGYTLVITGGSLTTATGSTSTIAGHLNLSGGTLDAAGSVSCGGTVNWTGGTISGTGTAIAAGGTLNLSGNLVTLAGTLENDGAAYWTSGTVSMNNGTINNDGSWTANSSGTLYAEDAANNTVNAFDNAAAGTFTQAGMGTTSFTRQWVGVAFNNSGIANVNQGTLQLEEGGTDSGAIDVSSGAVTTFSQDSYTFAAGASLNGAGTINFSGTETVAGPMTVSDTLNIASGITGAGALTVTGTLNWTGGTINCTGTTLIATGGTLNVSGSQVCLQGVLENDGTANWTSGFLYMTNGTVNNDGSWRANSSSTLYAQGEGGGTVNVFNNNATGTFTQEGTGTTYFNTWYTGVTFNNAGAVDVTHGALDFAAGGTSSGAIAVNSGAAATFSNSSSYNCTFTAGASLNGSGPITFSGTETVDGTTADPVTVSGILDIASGTITVAGALTVSTGTLNWTGGTIGGTGTTLIAAGGTLNLTGNSVTLAGVLENDGTANWTSGFLYLSNGTINNDGSWTANGSSTLNSQGYLFNTVNVFDNNVTGTFTQEGTGTTFNSWYTGVVFNNLGVVDADSGTFALTTGVTQVSGSTLTGGTWDVLAGATLSIPGAAVATNDGNVTLGGAGAAFAAINSLAVNNGSFSVLSGRTFTTAANLTNNGTLTIGGALDVSGAYSQASTATLDEQIGGTQTGQFGQLAATGTATLAGTLDVNLTNGFQPGQGASISFLTANAVAGSFSSVVNTTPGSTYIFSANYSNTSSITLRATLPPAVAVALDPASYSGVASLQGLTNVTTPTFDVTVNEAGVVDLDYNGNPAADLTQTVAAAGTYQFTLPQLADRVYTVIATFTPTVGTAVQAETQVTIDTQTPQLEQGLIVVAGPYSQRTLVFNENINPVSLVAGDLSIDDTANGSTVAVTSVSGSGDAYTVTFNTIDTQGNYVLSVGPGVTDLAGNPLNAAAATDTFTVVPDPVWLTAPLTIGDTNTTYDNRNIVVDGTTLTVSGQHALDSLYVIDGGVVTHAAGDTAGMQLSVSGNVDVDATSTITADGQGYGGQYDASGQGPGAGGCDGNNAGGGGHGGAGGSPYGGATYDSPWEPTALGSSGGAANGSWSATGGNGGGAIQLIVSGSLTLDGTITADGLAGVGGWGNRSGGGAGGSIWVTADTLAGSGCFQADGAAGYSYNASGGAGGGGGGRIAVYYQDASGFAGFASSTATSGSGAGSGAAGAPGTVAFIDQMVPNGGLNVYTTFELDADETADFGAITVHSGATFTVLGGTITAGDMTVEAGATITADGQGYAGQYDSGGQGPGAGGCDGNNAGGGGHGGAGGSPYGGATYDSPWEPTALGSSGGAANGSWSATGGNGGGAIRLIVSGSLTLDGTITANGLAGAGGWGNRSGGGAGGSIWVTADTLAGSGCFQADGAAGDSYNASGGAGGGGGGRIAVYYQDASGFAGFASSTATSGSGAGSGAAGAPGTVAFIDQSIPGGNLNVYQTFTLGAADSGQFGAVTVHAGGTFTIEGATTITARDVTVESGGTFTVGGATTITAGDVTVEAGGTITANGQGYAGQAGNAGQGPGAGGEDPWADAGGGGYGGAGGWPYAGVAYGSALTPTDLGSSGGGSARGGSGTVGGSGGGAIRLIVGGLLTLDGTITADGLQGSGAGTGGGSGGSIWVTTATLAGSGTFNADGGAGWSNWGGQDGGGGGGRIAVYYQDASGFSGFTASTANGGSGGGDGYGGAGAPGSVAFIDQTVPGGNWNVYQTFSLGPSDSGQFGAITVHAGGTFNVQGATTIMAGEVTVEAGGTITADGQGYAGQASSAGQGPGAGGEDPWADAGGGGYGGAGGWPYAGVAYGSALTPTDLGSSGGGSARGGSGTVGGSGGGAIRLIVGGLLTLDGTITADGLQGSGAGTGGGSGGSIWVTTATLAGNGTFNADGGSGWSNWGGQDGGGGGGRIAVYYQDASGFSGFTASTANGGSGANGGTGAPGSVAFIDQTVPGGNWNVYQTFSLGPSDSGQFGAVTVHAGGTFTIQGATTITAGEVTVEAGGTITADGQGYAGQASSAGQGPGAGGKDPWADAGGGGYGGAGGWPYAGVAYGSALTPTDLGSSGGASERPGSGVAGSGGGAIRLIVSGQLTLDGTITADGTQGSGPGTGGGSGGSIWVTTATLAGSGTFNADGGAGWSNWGGEDGGGGGGRIAVYYQDASGFSGFTASTANGGSGANGGTGAPGSVAFIDQTVPGGNWNVYQTFSLGPSDSGQFGAVTVHAGGTFTIQGATTITAGEVTVEAGGTITADGQGYAGQASSAGQGPGAGGKDPWADAGGGGYGGAGGWPYAGVAYGSALTPTDLGSSGGASERPGSGVAGSGGGAIRLIVSGQLTLDGTITADGTQGSGPGTGGGSGGSIWVTTATLAGSGTFNADGGAGWSNWGGEDGGGGGGRIAVYYQDASGFSGFTASTANGGNGANGGTGAPGTVYWATIVLASPELFVTGLSVNPAAGLVQSGGTLTVKWSDSNEGLAAVSNSFSNQVQIVNTATGQTLATATVPYDETSQGPLDVGGSVAQQCSIPLPDGAAGVGALQITVTNDIYNQVAKFNPDGTPEANSTATVTTTSSLANYPDLQVTGLAVTPSSPQSGQQVTVNWNDANTGDGTASGSWDDLVTVVNTTTGQTLFSDEVPRDASLGPLDAGQAEAHQDTFTLPNGSAGAGAIQVTATTDSGQTILEYDGNGNPAYDNNTSSITLTSTLPSAVFVNPAGGDWDDPNNWSTDAVPTAAEDVTIDTATAAIITIQPGDAESVNSLTIAACDMLAVTGGSLTVTANSTITGGLSLTGGSLDIVGNSTTVGNLNLGGGTLGGSGDLTIDGTLNSTGGTMAGTGTTVIAAGAAMNVLSGNLYLNGATLVNEGTVNQSGNLYLNGATLVNEGTVNQSGGQIEVSNSTAIDNQAGAAWNVQSDNPFGTGNYNWGAPPATFNNAGTLTSATSNADFGGVLALNNTGVLDVVSGSMTLHGGGSLGGSVSLAANTVLALDNSGYTWTAAFSGSSATLDVWSGGTVGVNGIVLNVGALNVNGTAIFNTGSTLSVDTVTLQNGTLNLSTGAAVALPNLTLQSNDALTGSDPLTVTGSLGSNSSTNIDDGGPITIAAGAAMNLFGGNLYLNGATLVNEGTVNQSGGQIEVSNSTVIDNQAGANWNVQSDNPFGTGNYNGGYGQATFNNAGTLTSATGNADFGNGLALDNTGVLDVQSGGMTLHGGGSLGGSVSLVANTVLALDNSGYTWTAAFSGSAATLDVWSGGTANFSVSLAVGALNINGTANFNPGSTLSIDTVTLQNGTLNLSTGAAVALPNLTLRSNDVLTGSDPLTVTASLVSNSSINIDDGGPITISAEAAMNVFGGNLYLNGATLVNEGTVNQSGGQIEVSNSTVIDNQAGANWNLQSDDPFGTGNYTWGAAPATFNNAGTLTSATSNADFGGVLALNNTGVLDVVSGSMTLHGGGSLGGSVGLAANSALALDNSGYTWTAAFSGSAATLDVWSGGTVNFDVSLAVGALNINGTANFNPGSVLSTNTVVLHNGTLNLNTGSAVSLPNLTLYGNDVLSGSDPLMVTASLVSNSSTNFNGSGPITIAAGAAMNVAGGNLYLNGATLVNEGTVNQGGGQIEVSNSTAIDNQTGAAWNVLSDDPFGTGNYTWGAAPATFNNAGTLTSATDNAELGGELLLSNTGTVNVTSGTLRLDNTPPQFSGNTLTGGTWDVAAGTTLSVPGAAPITTNDANVALGGPGAAFAPINSLAVNNGSFSVLAGAVFITGGDFANLGSLIITGTFNVYGSYTQAAGAALTDQIAGPQPGQSGTLAVAGTASLAGALNVQLTGGYQPVSGTVTPFVTASPVTGTFATVRNVTPGSSYTIGANYSSAEVDVSIDVSVLPPAPDLTVTGLAVSPAAGLQSGGTITASWDDSNSGLGAAAASFNDQVQVINTTTGQTLATAMVPYDVTSRGALPPGGAAQQQYSFTLPDGAAGAGQLEIAVTNDINNQVTKFNADGTPEASSTATLGTTSSLAPYPDLHATGLAIDASSVLQSGGTVTVDWNDSNVGDATASGAWYDRIQMVNTTTGQLLVYSIQVYSSNNSISAGDSAARSYSFSLPNGAAGVGQLSITVTADAGPYLLDYTSNGTLDTNRAATITAQSTLAPYPDLHPAGLVIDASSVRQSGGTVTVDWNDSNTGSGAAAGSWYDNITVVNTTTGQTLVNTNPAYSGNNIAAGGSAPRSYSFTLPNGAAGVGPLSITVNADAGANLLEYNPSGAIDTNRSANVSAQAALAAYPDLQVGGLAVDASSVLQSGDTVTVDWNDSNTGDATASGSWDDLVTVVNTTTGQTLFDEEVPRDASLGSLDAGQAEAHQYSFTLPNGLAGVGAIQVTVTTDSGHTILEYDSNGPSPTGLAAYDNNTSSITLTSTLSVAVSALLVQDGLTERSYVDQLTFQFNQPVTSSSAVPMTLTEYDTLGNLVGAVPLTPGEFQWSTAPGTEASVLTWSLESFAGGTSSLPDGYYELTLPGGAITNQYGDALDGGADYAANFFVLKGDVNGDGVVDNNDMLAVDAVLGSRPGSTNWNPNADLTRAGSVTTIDRIIVYQNMGHSITPPATTQVTAAVATSLPAWSFDGSTNLTATNSLPAGSPVNGMTFNADAGAFILDGNAAELGGDIENQSPNIQTINLPLTMLGSLSIDTATGNVAIAGDISQIGGSLGITKTGSHTLVLSGVNTYTGVTAVDQGTVVVTNSSALPTGTSLVVGAGGVFIFDPSRAAASQFQSSTAAVAVTGTQSTGCPAPGVAAAPLASGSQATSASESVSVATTASASLVANPVFAAIVASPSVAVSPASADPVVPIVVPALTPCPSPEYGRGESCLSRPVVNLPYGVATAGPATTQSTGYLPPVARAQAHDAALQSFNTPPLGAAEKAVALWDWNNPQSNRKQLMTDAAVDAVMAMLERM